jgi:hypothetical protein
VVSGTYAAAPLARYRGAVWVRPAHGREHVHAFLIFYAASGAVLAIEQAPRFTQAPPGRWTSVAVRALSPQGTALVAMGVDDADGETAVYVDDASLTGSTRFSYDARD